MARFKRHQSLVAAVIRRPQIVLFFGLFLSLLVISIQWSVSSSNKKLLTNFLKESELTERTTGFEEKELQTWGRTSPESSYVNEDKVCGFNSTPVVYLEQVKNWTQQSFKFHRILGFYHFSAYRMGPQKFAILGLQDTFAFGESELKIPPSSGSCIWHDNSSNKENKKSIKGVLRFLYGGEHHDRQFETVVIHCTLEEVTSPCGGYLLGMIYGVEVVLFREDGVGELSPKFPLPYFITVCTPPIKSPPNPLAVFEWMSYFQKTLGGEKIIFYNSEGISEKLVTKLKKKFEENKGVSVEIIKFVDNLLQQADRAFSFAQGLAFNDCLYRSRFFSRWIISASFDDFLEPLVPKTTFKDILIQYDDKPWLSVGSFFWDTTICALSNEKNNRSFYSIDRMIIRQSKPFCRDNLLFPSTKFCLYHYGFRTLIANPRLTELVQTHNALIPLDGGVHLNSETELRRNFFEGYSQKYKEKDRRICQRVVSVDPIAQNFVIDRRIEEKMVF